MIHIAKDEKIIIKKSLQTVLKGSGFFLIGSIVSSILIILCNLIIVRVWTKADLGIYALAFSFLSLFSTIGILGIAQGVNRNLAYYKGKKQHKNIPSIISSSILLTLIASSIIGIVLLISSSYIVENILNESSFIVPLRIFCIAIPVNNLILIITSIFKGLNEIKPLVYFQHISQNLFFFVFLIYIVVLKISFVNIFYAYLLSLIITTMFLVFYTRKKLSNFDISFVKKVDFSQAKPMLLFSLPLLVVQVLNTSTSWITVLMLGGIKTAADVGLYKASGVLTGLIGYPFAIILVLYIPVVSGLYGSNKIDEIKKIYSILTKWICFVTLPLFLILFLFTDTIVYFFYGSRYEIISYAVKILSLAAIITNFTGPNGATLIAIGKQKFVMYSTIIAAVVSIFLNIYLIPIYGFEGAALSVAASFTCFNILKCSIVYILTKASPISYNLVKPTILTIITTVFLYMVTKRSFELEVWFVPIFIAVFYMVYFVFFLLTYSIEIQDIEMIRTIGKKLHIKTKFLTNILLKFLN